MNNYQKNIDLFGSQVKTPIPKLTIKQRAVQKQEALQARREKEQKRNEEIMKWHPEESKTEIATISTKAAFRRNGIVIIDQYCAINKTLLNSNAKNNLLSQNQNDNTYNGYLSPATRRYIKSILSAWITSIEIGNDLKKSKKEVNSLKVFPTFVTLTLPSSQVHSDKVIKENILHPFIQYFQTDPKEVYTNGPKKGQPKGYGVKGYFWRAEPQKNTNIHFHVLFDKYIPWERIREKWNQCCERLGYVTRYSYILAHRYKNGFKVNQKRLIEDKKMIASISVEAIKNKVIPENIPELLKQYLEVAIESKIQLPESVYKQVAIEKQRENYEKEKLNGFKNPPSTDISAIQHLESVSSYVLKYVAKKPKEIPLEKNQEVKFNETLNRECVYTYKETINPISGEVEKEEVNMQYYNYTNAEFKANPDACYKVKFEERKINGRLWGCSDILKKYKPKEGEKIETDNEGMNYVVRETENSNITRTPIALLKYFTKEIGYKSVIQSKSEKEVKITISPVLDEDFTAINYINKIKSSVGEEELKRINKTLGPSFEKMRGQIIPLNPEELGYKPNKSGKKVHKKHADILKDLAPELYQQYIAYYTNIFNSIYN